MVPTSSRVNDGSGYGEIKVYAARRPSSTRTRGRRPPAASEQLCEGVPV